MNSLFRRKPQKSVMEYQQSLRIVARVSIILASARGKRTRSHVTCSPCDNPEGLQQQSTGRFRGGGPGVHPLRYFQTKMRPEGPKIFFWRSPPPLPQSLDDSPAPPLSEGLDPPLHSTPPLQSKNRWFCWFLAAVLVSSGSTNKSACFAVKLQKFVLPLWLLVLHMKEKNRVVDLNLGEIFGIFYLLSSPSFWT